MRGNKRAGVWPILESKASITVSVIVLSEAVAQDHLSLEFLSPALQDCLLRAFIGLHPLYMVESIQLSFYEGPQSYPLHRLRVSLYIYAI